MFLTLFFDFDFFNVFFFDNAFNDFGGIQVILFLRVLKKYSL